MPSLAQGYVRGLSLSEQLKDAERRRKRDELTDILLGEQIESERSRRKITEKSLLAEIEAQKKQEAEQAKQEELKTGITHHWLFDDPATLRNLYQDPGAEQIVAGKPLRTHMQGVLGMIPGLNWEEQEEARRVEKKIKGAPGVVPWGVSEIEESKIPQAARMALGLEPKAKAEKETRKTQPKRMTSAQYRAQASSLKQQAEQSESTTEKKELSERAERLRKEANKLFRQEQGRAGMLPSTPFTPGKRTPIEEGFALEGFRPEEEEPPVVELPPSLVNELEEFESFEDWYDNLSEDARVELEADPETLKAIRDWYAVP